MKHHPLKTLATALLISASLPAAAAPFVNPLDQPSASSPLAASRPLLATAMAGKRIIAVGQRGHIVYSDDDGANWKQASVPVSNDLVGVHFPTPKAGWAVGHGGVVLHSSDGGATWVKQLDGRRAADIGLRYYQARVASYPELAQLIERETALAADGSSQPFMDVHFESEIRGFVVGAFNRIFRTEDGGKTWAPWMDRTDNPNELHFYAIRATTGGVYMAGEQGMVWKLDAAKNRFVAARTPYTGTLFGMVADADTLLAYGMRGSLYRSPDGGANWEKVAMPGVAGITGGAALANGAIVIANQAGGLLVSKDRGKTFSAVNPAKRMPYFGAAPVDSERISLVGPEGVRVETIR